MNRSRFDALKASVNDAGPPLSPLPHGVRQASPGWRFALPILVLLYVAFGIVHALRTPVGFTGYQDAPDEYAHVTVARVIASGRLPTRESPGMPRQSQMTYEWHQPPLYYFLVSRLLPAGDKVMRLLSILIGVGCILAIYQAARVLLPERPETAILAAGIAALTPGHIAITSVVNNDALLELCFSGYLLVLFLALARGLTLQRSLLLGAILGAALLTKVTAVLLLPLTLLALWLLSRNGESRTAVLRAALVIATVAAIISGWWYVRNGMLYHEWLPLTAFRQSFEGTAKATDIIGGQSGLSVSGWPGYAQLVASWTFKSFFAVYSSNRGSAWGIPAFLPEQLYWLAGLVVICAAAGLVVLATRHRTEFTGPQTYGIYLLSGIFALVALSFVTFTSKYFQAQGRYFYPAMLPISLACAMGWQSIFPKRYSDVAGVLLLAFFGVFVAAFLLATG